MLNHIGVTAIIILYSLSNGFAAGNSGQTEQDGLTVRANAGGFDIIAVWS